MSLYNEHPAIAALSESRPLAEAIAREAGLPLLPIEERTFESGEFKLRPLESVRGRCLLVLQTLAGTDEAPIAHRLLRLLFLLQGLRDAGAGERVAVMPYHAFARKDRRTQTRDPVSSRYVAELLEAAGASCVVGLEVHNPAAFDNAFRVPTIHLTALPLLAHHFAQHAAGSTASLVVVSPDVGGIKRAQLFREQLASQAGRDIDIAFVEKRRANEVISGGSLAGDVGGRTVIIVDDLCASGSTLIRAATACQRGGAAAVHVVVVHAPLQAGLMALAESQTISSILITDSTGLIAPVKGEGKLTMVSIAPLIGQVLQRMTSGQAVAPLLERWPVWPQD
jgi:ribose-phosphate pyrophosphokinase